jgi:hypothetical protein
MSPLTLAEMYNFSKELTASIFRAEEDEFYRFHRNIGRFLPHFRTSGPRKHYVTFNTYSSSIGRAIALVVRPWLPTRVFGSASVTHVKFEADHSSLEHIFPCQLLFHHCHCVIVLTRRHLVTPFSWEFSVWPAFSWPQSTDPFPPARLWRDKTWRVWSEPLTTSVFVAPQRIWVANTRVLGQLQLSKGL